MKNIKISRGIASFYPLFLLIAILCLSPTNSFSEGNYLIITYPAFESSLVPLEILRTADGFTVETVTTTWIYDNYPDSDGKLHKSLKAFIQDAYDTWTIQPEYILLVGDGSVRTNGDIPTNDILTTKVPVYFTDDNYYKWDRWQYSDDYYVDVEDDDNIPDLYIGRLPAKTTSELVNIVQKIVMYENLGPENWNRDILMAVGDSYPPVSSYMGTENEDDYFAAIRNESIRIGSLLSNLGGLDLHRLRDSDIPVNEEQEYYRDEINPGHSITVFNGNTQLDSLFPFLHSDTVDELSNFNRYPLFLDMTCATTVHGNRTDEREICAPILFTQNKGGIAVIGSNAVFSHNTHFIICKYFVEQMVLNPDITLGEAMLKAKKSLFQDNLVLDRAINYFELIGDPALKLNVSFADRFPYIKEGWPAHIPSCDGVAITTKRNDIRSESSENDLRENLDMVPVVNASPNMMSFLTGINTNGSEDFTKYVKGVTWSALSGDINSSGNNEMISVRKDTGDIIVFGHNGATLEGFPMSLGEEVVCPPALADVNNDGRLDIIVATRASYGEPHHIRVVRYDGDTSFGGWSSSGYVFPDDDYIISGIAAGDINNDGNTEIVVSGIIQDDGGKGFVHAINHRGRDYWTGDPKEIGNLQLSDKKYVSPPSLARLDGDQNLEIVVGMYGEKVEVTSKGEIEDPVYEHDILVCLAENGNELWRYASEDEYETATFRPIIGTSNSNLGKILLAYGEIPVYTKTDDMKVNGIKGVLFNVTGSSVTKIDNIPNGNKYYDGAAFADVNNDGATDILVGIPRKLLGIDGVDQGNISGWNCRLNYTIVDPAVCDLDGDGMTDIVVGDNDAVYAFTTDTPYDDSHLSMDWSRTLHDNLNTNNYEIFAPTNVVAEDVDDDQGRALHISWTPSLDDGGGRSSRVNGYELYRQLFIGPKTSRNITVDSSMATSLTDISETDLAVKSTESEIMDMDGFELVSDTIAAGDYEYTDSSSGIHPKGSYQYYLVAYENSTHSFQGGKRYSTRSIKDSATAHDNIAPAPPTDAGYALGSIWWGLQQVDIAWTLSVDDPYYVASENSLSDTKSRLLSVMGDAKKKELSDHNATSILSDNTLSPIDRKLSEGIDAKASKDNVSRVSGNEISLTVGSVEDKRKLAEDLNSNKRDTAARDISEDAANRVPSNDIANPDIAIDVGDNTQKDKDGSGGSIINDGDVESYIIIIEVDHGSFIEIVMLEEVEAGVDTFNCGISVTEVPNITIKIAAKDKENISDYEEAVEVPFNVTTKNDGEPEDMLNASGADGEMAGILPRVFAEPVAFPNPSNGSVTFGWPVGATIGEYQISVFDLSGRKVWDATVNDTNQCQWNSKDNRGMNIAAGVYVVRIESGTEAHVLKFVKEDK